MTYIQKNSPLKKLQKKETQQQLDDRWETWLKTNRGAKAFDDRGNLTWSVNDNKIKTTTFNAKWREKITKEALNNKKKKTLKTLK